MPRPFKCRKIGHTPGFCCFKPAGARGCDLERVLLAVDEFEAFRLADLLGMYHEDAAREMSISRQTFGNILSRARQKVADAIVNGKVLQVEGVDCRSDQEKESCSSCRGTRADKSE